MSSDENPPERRGQDDAFPYSSRPDPSSQDNSSTLPPGHFVPPNGPEASGPATQQWSPQRRRLDVPASANLALGLPGFLYSAGVLAVIALLLHSLQQTILAFGIILIWVMSGPLLFWKPIENAFCRVFLRLRTPTQTEHERLSAVWAGVSSAAGVDESKFSLWVEDSDNTNAYAAGGHAVAVTSWALESLSPTQLAAALAHELGHHLGGHTWTKLLLYWYSIPGRLLARLVIGLVRGIWRASINMTLSDNDKTSNTGCFGITIVGVLCLGVGTVAYAVIRMNPFFLIFLFLFFALPVLLAYLRRMSELQADLLATRIGYGPALIEVYRAWQMEGDDQARQMQTRGRQLMETHPSCAERIRTIEKQLSGK